jgi:hypothetical protein
MTAIAPRSFNVARRLPSRLRGLGAFAWTQWGRQIAPAYRAKAIERARQLTPILAAEGFND